MKTQTKKLTTLAMLSALAYIVMVLARIPFIPAAPFLKYDPKDVVIVIAGFIYGPLSALSVSFVVSFAEMLTVSETGFIGLAMNVFSSAAFACPAAWLYKRLHTLRGAAAGLFLGVTIMAASMLLWNYLITPLYMGVPRSVIKGMLLPVFLPFNLLKGVLNAAVTMLLYKPLRKALSKMGTLNAGEGAANAGRRPSLKAAIASLLVIGCCVMLILFLWGKI